MRHTFLIMILFSAACSEETVTDSNETISTELDWLNFDKELFEIAKEKEKLVLLDVGANWCHWCHVMDDSTYGDPGVIEFLNKNFVISKEDQDSRPDLYSAYRSYGWPATIIFNHGGEELYKMRGYQYRKKFIRQLQAVLDNPVPMEEIVTEKTEFGEIDADDLFERYANNLDHKQGGYKSSKMQLHKEGLEFGLLYGDKDERLNAWTEKTYQASLYLVDPVWGGVSQYSDSWVWTNPHYEKLLKVQANYISAYCRYGVVKGDESAIAMAEKIYGYCDRFLSSNPPLFDNSQNADLIDGVHSEGYYDLDEEGRLAQGIPSVDKKQYLKENAMMVSALIDLWAATGKEGYLARAKEVEVSLSSNFRDDNLLYNREIGGNSIYSFDDNRRLVGAWLDLYSVTGEPRYLDRLNRLMFEIIVNFMNDEQLFVSHYGELIVPAGVITLDNLDFCQDLFKFYDSFEESNFKNPAGNLIDSLDRREITTKMWFLPYTMEVIRYMNNEPYHAVWLSTEFGSDAEKQLVRRIMLDKNPYIIIERKDLDNLSEEDEMLYGGIETNTLFMCTSSFCSSPIRSLEDLEEFLEFSHLQN